MGKEMEEMRELNKSEIKMIQGGGPIADWIACHVNAFIEIMKSTEMTTNEREAFIKKWELRDQQFSIKPKP